jgi:hypothetical protein
MTSVYNLIRQIWYQDVRPIDRATLIIELLVLVLIAYEVGHPIYHQRKVRRRSRAITGFVESGRKLQNLAPGIEASDAEVSQWIESVEAWNNETHDFLKRYSAEAAASYLHNPGKFSGDYMGVAVKAQRVRRGLEERLNNLRDIMEKADVYF